MIRLAVIALGVLAFLPACGSSRDLACYSGGGLIWKGKADKLTTGYGCVSFTDRVSKLEMKICNMACYMSEEEKGAPTDGTK